MIHFSAISLTPNLDDEKQQYGSMQNYFSLLITFLFCCLSALNSNEFKFNKSSNSGKTLQINEVNKKKNKHEKCVYTAHLLWIPDISLQPLDLFLT